MLETMPIWSGLRESLNLPNLRNGIPFVGQLVLQGMELRKLHQHTRKIHVRSDPKEEQ